jgi:hypothetical protein
VDKSLNDLRDKRLLTVDPEKMSRIELSTKNSDIEFDRNFGHNKNKDEWQILKPKPLRADTSQVSELARNLTDARMDLSSYDAKGNASAFAHATPLATAKVTDESGTQELQVRSTRAGKSQVGNTGDMYYPKSSAVDGIYKINSDLGKVLDKSLEDFRNKKLFDFGFAEPDKIELHIGSKAYFLTRSGDDWWSNGKKMDAGNVQSYISKLRDLTANKFPDSGFANPVMEVSVTSDDGKNVEKVLVAKSKEGYLAKRENEPVLYQLTSTSVDDLQKAADEMKPNATASK